MPPPSPPLMTTAPAGGAPPPPALQLVRSPPLQAPWSTGLFDCCDDIPNCCVTCVCPCITFGQIAEIVDRRTIPCGVSGALYALMLCVTGCACLYSCFYRSKMRGQLFLEEAPCADCLLHCCCESCALCQEYRELKIRGFFSFNHGRERSMETQRSVRMLPPAEHGGMQR